MNSTKFRQKLNNLQGQRDLKLREYQTATENLKASKKKVATYEKALALVNNTAKEVQSKLQYHISDLSSMILQSVFEDGYEVQIEFNERRNKTEADITLKQNGNVLDIKEGTAGGELDTLGFALRLVAWTLQNPKSRNTIILDETFKGLSVEYHENAGKMLKEISERLGLQIIMVTHKDKFKEYADKVFKVDKVNNVSSVEEI